MTDAPERIWFDPDKNGMGWTDQQREAMAHDVEYVRADLAKPDWQPIETAPCERLLFWGSTRHDTKIAFTGWKAQNGRFYADSGDAVWPTHWMPSPPPPE